MRKKTTEDYKQSVKELVGDEYSILSEYVSAKTPIKMKHNVCGYIYDVRPSNFLSGKRCPQCNHPTYNIEIAKTKAKKLNMTILETEYKGVFDKMRFVCDIHPELGEQLTTMTGINQGHNCCPKCRYNKTSKSQTQKISIDDIKKEFADRNLLLLSEDYINCKSPLKYICNKHPNDGEQQITYDAFKKNTKFCCNSCAKEYISNLKMTPTTEIIKIVENHGFEFVNVKKEGRKTFIEYICPKHRDKGTQIKSLSHIKSGEKCIYCAGTAKFTQDEFIQRVQLNDKNIQILSEYNGNKSYIDCRCKECGYTWTTQAVNLMYSGKCPNCAGSKGEMKIRDFLDSKGIDYRREFVFDDLFGDCNKPLRFDFAVFNKNKTMTCLIEFDGVQHYQPINFWGNKYAYTQTRFETLQRYDKRKDDYCKEHNIKLIRIPYWDFDNIEKILDKELEVG